MIFAFTALLVTLSTHGILSILLFFASINVHDSIPIEKNGENIASEESDFDVVVEVVGANLNSFLQLSWYGVLLIILIAHVFEQRRHFVSAHDFLKT